MLNNTNQRMIVACSGIAAISAGMAISMGLSFKEAESFLTQALYGYLNYFGAAAMATSTTFVTYFWREYKKELEEQKKKGLSL